MAKITVKFMPTLQDVESAMDGTGDSGFCVCCGATTTDAEPDARGYECEACGERGVYGIEELLMRGLVQT
jgi:hypothetical protein